MSEAQRLVIDEEETQEAEDYAPDSDEAIAAEFGLRPTTEGEVSIRAWSGGDPVRALRLADSLARERREILRAQARDEAAYADELAELGAWLAGEEARRGRRMEFIDNLLRMYQEDFRADEKTVRLPNAELKRRKNRDRVEWDEDDALRFQQAHHPEDVTLKLNKSALKQRLEKAGSDYIDPDTGEVVEFLREVPPEEPESFTVVQEVGEDDE